MTVTLYKLYKESDSKKKFYIKFCKELLAERNRTETFRRPKMVVAQETFSFENSLGSI